MATAEKTMLYGTVEMDETYVGGHQRGNQDKPGNGYSKKADRYRPSAAWWRDSVLPCGGCQERDAGTVHQGNVSEDVDVIVTDEFNAYPRRNEGYRADTERHKTIKHKAKVYVDGEIHTNTVESAFSLLKRGIIGRGIGFLQSIWKPTLRKCNSGSIAVVVPICSLIHCATWSLLIL